MDKPSVQLFVVNRLFEVMRPCPTPLAGNVFKLGLLLQCKYAIICILLLLLHAQYAVMCSNLLCAVLIALIIHNETT